MLDLSNNLKNKIFSLHTLLLLAGIYILLPERILSYPHNGLDASWVIAINMAIKQNLVFGRDFIFTFGPLGFLYSGLPLFIPKFIIMLFHLLLFGAIGFISNFYLQQIKTNLAKAGFFFFTLIIYIELFSEKAFLLLLIFLFFVFYHLYQQKQFALIFAGFIALLTFFIKLNTGLLLTFLLLPYLFFTSYFRIEKWSFSFAFVLGYSILLFLFSSLLNVEVFGYVSNAFGIIHNYNDAVNLPPLPLMFLLAVLIILAYGAALLLNVKTILDNRNRLFRIMYVSMAFFVLFKEGFVRADSHMMLFFGKIVPLVSLLYFFEDDKKFKLHLNYTILLTGLLTLISTQVFYGLGEPLTRVRSKITKIAYRDVLLGEYEHHREHVLLQQQKFAKFPKRIIKRLEGKTVDIIPTNISLIYFNDLHYNPRPSIQSYASYSEKLDGLNADKYASQNAPYFIIYAIGSIDNRHPFWDESKTKITMLTHYRVVDSFSIKSNVAHLGANEDYILLKRRGKPLNIVEGEKTTFSYQLGDKLEIPKSDNLVYLQIDFKYTFIGKMMRLFFQPNRLVAEMWCDGFDDPSVNVAIKPILKGGVLINKKVTTINEAKLFFQNQGNDNPPVKIIRFAPKYGFRLGLKEDLEITLNEYKVRKYQQRSKKQLDTNSSIGS
jgi:hypothetical protein